MSGAITIFLPRLPRMGQWPWSRRGWTVEQLNLFITESGFDMALEIFDPAKQVGTVHGRVGDVLTCFEFYADSIAAYLEAVEEMRGEDDFPYSADDLATVRRHESVVQLVLHYRPRERAAAAITAACLGTMVGGVVLEEGVWAWRSGESALSWARQVEEETRTEHWEEGGG